MSIRITPRIVISKHRLINVTIVRGILINLMFDVAVTTAGPKESACMQGIACPDEATALALVESIHNQMNGASSGSQFMMTTEQEEAGIAAFALLRAAASSSATP